MNPEDRYPVSKSPPAPPKPPNDASDTITRGLVRYYCPVLKAAFYAATERQAREKANFALAAAEKRGFGEKTRREMVDYNWKLKQEL